MSMISREAAIEAITAYARKLKEEKYHAGSKVAREFLKILTDLPGTEWKPCNKPPKVGTDVLLRFEKNMAVGFYSNGDWNVNSGNGFYTGLVASDDQPIEWASLEMLGGMK